MSFLNTALNTAKTKLIKFKETVKHTIGKKFGEKLQIQFFKITFVYDQNPDVYDPNAEYVYYCTEEKQFKLIGKYTDVVNIDGIQKRKFDRMTVSIDPDINIYKFERITTNNIDTEIQNYANNYIFVIVEGVQYKLISVDDNKLLTLISPEKSITVTLTKDKQTKDKQTKDKQFVVILKTTNTNIRYTAPPPICVALTKIEDAQLSKEFIDSPKEYAIGSDELNAYYYLGRSTKRTKGSLSIATGTTWTDDYYAIVRKDGQTEKYGDKFKRQAEFHSPVYKEKKTLEKEKTLIDYQREAKSNFTRHITISDPEKHFYKVEKVKENYLILNRLKKQSTEASLYFLWKDDIYKFKDINLETLVYHFTKTEITGCSSNQNCVTSDFYVNIDGTDLTLTSVSSITGGEKMNKNKKRTTKQFSKQLSKNKRTLKRNNKKSRR